MSKTYIDYRGYRRYLDSYKLVHRYVAYKYCYDYVDFDVPYSKLIVHHKDEQKLNNSPSNLEVMLQTEHERLHGFDTPLKLSEFEKQSNFFSNMINKILDLILGYF